VRLGHSHIRIGSFQRLYVLEEVNNLAALVDYCLVQYPGPAAPEDAPGRDLPAIILLHQVVARLAELAASYMAAGFVHGVLNSDNMAITGESFDYGPWRFLPAWDAGFTAAYFDHNGLYAFGRQPGAIRWNCAQLALSLSPLAPEAALIAALDRFGPLYQAALLRRFLWRMGAASKGAEADTARVEAAEKAMRESGTAPHLWFAAARGGDPVFAQGMLIDEVEQIWAAIAEHDDWQKLTAKIAALRAMGDAMGDAPPAAGHGDRLFPDFA
jgi:serine/tyrosine/threonine adenylyltransferase